MRFLLVLGLFAFISGCSIPSEDRFIIKKQDFQQLNGWDWQNHLAALHSFRKSCVALSKKAHPATVISNIRIDAEIWQDLCTKAEKAQNAQEAQSFFEENFIPYRVFNNDSYEGMFTGYYEPILSASLRKTARFKYPVYALPSELETGKYDKSNPYYSRQEIEEGALKGRKLEILWTDDPVMLFFMQIQGSGRVKLRNGEELQIGYAGKNWQPYVSLGKVMIEKGLLTKEEVSLFSIRDWLYKNPEEASELMRSNPSYVFFRIIEGKGAVGSIGVVLTPFYSIAVDNRYMPYGLPVYIQTKIPLVGDNTDSIDKVDNISFNQLTIAQDTGGAIKSPIRADIFFGAVSRAEYMAGNMKNYGSYSLLLPKRVSVDASIVKQ
ncbi:MAG: MltA domain-containing protein [Rickettsiales bacterium]